MIYFSRKISKGTDFDALTHPPQSPALASPGRYLNAAGVLLGEPRHPSAGCLSVYLGSTGASTAISRSVKTLWYWRAATSKTAGVLPARPSSPIAKLVWSTATNGKNYDTEVEVMFVDFHMGDYETGLVISADHPELATMSLGLDKLWNRIMTLSILTVLLGGMGVGMIFLTLRNLAGQRAVAPTGCAHAPCPLRLPHLIANATSYPLPTTIRLPVIRPDGRPTHA